MHVSRKNRRIGFLTSFTLTDFTPNYQAVNHFALRLCRDNGLFPARFG
jgi:hypothetical protein